MSRIKVFKKIIICVLIANVLMATQCYDDDEVNFSSTIVENPDLLMVENNENTFVVGDFITIQTVIEDAQRDINENELLISDFISNLSTQEIEYGLDLYKMNAYGEYDRINLTDSEENLVAQMGEVQVEFGRLFITSVLENDSVFRSSISLKLLATGRYQLRRGGVYYNNNFIEIEQTNFDEYLLIRTSIQGDNEEGFYEFEVN